MEAVERENSTIVRKKNKIGLKIFIALSIIAVITAVSIILYRVSSKYLHSSDSVTALYDKWEERNYEEVYEITGRILAKKPFQNTARTFRGYSAFYIAIAQTENSVAQAYLDEAINSLRIALQTARNENFGQLEYMLGKSYFFKNSISSYHFYADLCIKYLNMAVKDGYSAQDIPEYLGLSYAAAGETQKSIQAFTEALLVRETDTLLMAIAEQYYNIGAGNAAKQYLIRVKSISENEDLILKSRNLLGNIYLDEKKYKDAEKEFNFILEKNENSADAHYSLGVLYEKQGDLVKARSEWRKCLRLQVNHSGALKKINEYERK